MARVQSIRRSRYSSCHIVSCLLLCSIVSILVLTVNHSRALICLRPIQTKQSDDRQDPWRYQNSVTGHWYPWPTVYKEQKNQTDWPVKWLHKPPTSSLGIIVYLATRGELDSLNRSLAQLFRLRSSHPRPVVIFHEGDLIDDNTQNNLALTLGTSMPLAFERIDFASNSLRPAPVSHRYSRKYLDMCRFFTLMLPTHPILTLFEFYWRLDTHSFIFGATSIADPFEIMQQQQIQYAFIMTNEEADNYAIDLWSTFHQFLQRHCLKPSRAVRQTQTDWFGRYSLSIIFTNFAIANVSLWRHHSLVQAWLQTVDRSGGIYRHRWGDAPIHTLALAQFVERDRIVRLRYFGYFHRREYVCARGTDANLCRKQVRPFQTDPKMKYLTYDDGCFSSRASLCHFYPEMSI